MPADERTMTETQAYEAAFRFVAQYRRREAEPVAASLDLLLAHMEPTDDGDRTSDPAAWEDWQHCVSETLRGGPQPGTGVD